MPNSTYQLTYGPYERGTEGSSATVTGWRFFENGTEEDSSAIDGGYFYYAYDSEQDKLVKCAVPSYYKTLPTITGYTSSAPAGTPILTTLEETSSSSGVFEGSVTVNIWIEGCDREARRALAGGKLDIGVIFVGIEHIEEAGSSAGYQGTQQRVPVQLRSYRDSSR